MKQDVLVSITGLYGQASEEGEAIELIVKGKYYKKNGKHFIFYDEMMSENQIVTKNMVKISDDCMEVTKKGEANTSMVFEKNKKNTILYSLPVGEILMGISTEELTLKEEEKKLDVNVNYEVELDSTYCTRHQMHLEITELPVV